VTLNTEVLPTGGLVPSFLVESFSIFTSDSTPHYHLLLAKVSSPVSPASWMNISW
jgi:hypothetical protein